MERLSVTLWFFSVLAASGELDADALRHRAYAQVAAIEPLPSELFTRTESLTIEEHGATRAIAIGYAVRSSTGAAELRQRIVGLFTAHGWAIGMPPGFSSPYRTYPDGRVDYPLAFFRATPERIKGQYCIHHAHLFIADDLATVKCTYNFSYVK